MNLWANPYDSGARHEHANTGERVNDSKKLRVVLVEDSPIIRARLAETLSEIPNLEIVGQAESESDALSLLDGGGWDAVVLDLQLRQGTGLGVLRKLRQGGRPSNAKVIVFTNYAFPQYRDRSIAFGADFFFDKAREFHRVRDVLADLASGEPPRPAS
jgi:DNA-binding NarL/FixJ family response regulator